MINIANVIRGMDKRMSYNLRLIGSVMMSNEPTPEAQSPNQDPQHSQSAKKEEKDARELKEMKETKEEIDNILKDKSVAERKQTVIPKIKKMSEFTSNKLEMKSELDQQQIMNVKKKLKSID